MTKEQKNEKQACCACITVVHSPEDLGDGTKRDRWVCADCRREFAPNPEDLELLQDALVNSANSIKVMRSLIAKLYDKKILTLKEENAIKALILEI